MNQTCYISKYYPHKFPDITSPHLNQTFSKHPKKKKKKGTHLGVLGTYSSCSTIRPSENNRHGYLPSRHVICFCSRINDMINRLI